MIEISKQTGTININGFDVKSDTNLSHLPDPFLVGEEMIVTVARNRVPCRFASLTEIQDNIKTKVDLRFEYNQLVSVFISLTDLTKNYEEALDFYSSTPERKKLHLDWLQSNLGEQQESYSEYEWGKAGVAQDKSDNIHIFIHYKNGSHT